MKASQSVIIILLVANLVATVWFGLNNGVTNTISVSEKAAEHELPSVVNSEERSRLYAQFAKAFNAQDYSALYNMFGPAARAQFSKESADAEFIKLNKYFGSVQDGVFTHSELAGNQGNTNYYNLYYTVKLPQASEFGGSGRLKITIAVQGNEYQVFGIRLHAGSA